MNKLSLNFAKIAEYLFLVAAFFLSLRTEKLMLVPFLHLADIILILATMAVFLSGDFRNFIRQNFAKLIPYLKWLGVVAILIVAGQIFSFARFGANPLAREVLMDYFRLIFNLGIFILAALMVYRNPRILRFIGLAIVVSFVLIIPVYFLTISTNQAIYFSAARLSGLIENPIVFGAWASIALVLGAGFIFENIKAWKKIALSAWLSFIAAFLLWSGARTAWLSIVLVVILLLIILWKQKDWNKLKFFLTATAAIFIAGYFLIGNNYTYNVSRNQTYSYLTRRAVELVTTPDPYYESRINFWLESAAGIYRFPFGFGFVDLAAKDQYPGFTGTFLELVVYGGVLALAAFVTLIIKLVKAAKITAEQAIQDNADYIKISWLIAGVALLANITPFNFFQVRIFWFVLGIIAGVVLQKNRE